MTLLHRAGSFEFTNTTGRYITLFNWVLTASGLRRAHMAAHALDPRRRPRHWRQLLPPVVHDLRTGPPRQPARADHRGVGLARRGPDPARKNRVVRTPRRRGGRVSRADQDQYVGFFFIAATGVWLLANLRPPSLARAGTVLAGIVLVLLPPLLMNHFLGEDWARLFAVLGSITAATVLGATWAARQPNATVRDIILFLAAGLGVTVVVTLAILALQGTGPADPAGRRAARAAAASGRLSFRPALAAGHAGGRRAVTGLRRRLLVQPVAHLAAGRARNWPTAGGAGLPRHLPGSRFAQHARLRPGLRAAASVADGFPAGTGARPTPESSAKTWLGLVLAGQYLHAYPIAGSQISWGTFLFIPLVASGAWRPPPT